MVTCCVRAMSTVMGSHSIETIYSGKLQFSNVIGSYFSVRVGREECKEGSGDYKMGTHDMRESGRVQNCYRNGNP